MSQENVEIVRQSFQACNRRDADAAVSGYHPDIEYRFVAALDGQVVIRGREAIRATFLELWGDWEETFSDPAQLLDLGDRVLVEHTDRRVGRQGITIEQNGFQMWTLEEGLVTRIEGFDTWSEALEAAELRE